MDIGVFIFPTDQTMQPVELGRAVEDRGFESLWFPEHSHIPTSRVTPWGGRKGAPPLPDYYWRTHDQFVALSAVAATTTTLKVGTGICLLAQRDPIWTAKEVASIDMISGGRFVFGIGYGWNVEEYEEHGLVFSERRDRIRECVLAMKELWTAEEASFDGEHVSFSPSWSWPKPVQDPHPPIILGGSVGPKTAVDIAEFCDGWMPIGGLHDLEGGLKTLAKACADAGRALDSIDLGVFFGVQFKAEQMKPLADAGVTRVIAPLPPKPSKDVLPVLDEYAKMMS